ncbi:MAG: DUF5723 family protein [Prevotellaceae bacterium]|jgi:hypothetical protein|nr:DUF5723 family protein [Prevotellaceae bacterium]
MKLSKIKKAVALAAWMLAVQPRYEAQAQHNATMYFMRDLPAVNMLNPAFQPEAGSIYVGMPLLSSVYFDGGITLGGMNIGNLLNNTPRLTKAAANPAPYEGAYANADVNLINVGILVRDMYFTFDITEKTRAEAAIPADVVRLAWYGNAPYIGKTIAINELGAQVCSYAEIALGFSKDIVRDRITIGAKLKRLLGITFADAEVGKDAFLQTNADWSTTLRVSPEFNIAGITESLPDDICTYEFAGKGWGMDMGFEIKNELFIVSGSVLNVGVIRWRNVRHEKLETDAFELTFRGAQLNGNTDLTKIIDTVKAQKFVRSSENIWKWTPSTATISVAYPLNKHLVAGALAGVAIGRYNSYPLLALSLSTWKHPINGSLSYSYSHSHNLGMGLLFGRREAQLHVICDNILAADYQRAQKINLRLGLNLLLGAPRQTGDRKKTWAPINTIDSPTNTYKTTGKPGPLNRLLSPTAQPTNKQPLNPTTGNSNAEPAREKKP